MEDYEDFVVKIPRKTVNWRGCNGDRKEIKEIASKEELEQILQHFKMYNFKHYLIFRLLIETGMRKGELINSKYSDLNTKKRYIRTTGKTEDVAYYYSKELARFLKQYLNEREKISINNETLFLTNRMAKYSNRAFNLLLKNACKKIGIEKNITCHTFRRTLNTYRKKIGCSNEDRKILLNHKVNDVNIESYLIYEHEEYLALFDKYNPYENLNL
ncbi:Tyrosine recombinase XerC [subsurface metagenome]